MAWTDEEDELEERRRLAEHAFQKGVRDTRRFQRQQRAERGWFNWYANRGRLSLSPTASELSRVSWRRAH